MCLRNAITNQKQVSSLMFGADRRAHNAEFFREINTLPFTDLYSYMSMMFVSKSLKGLDGADMYQVYLGLINIIHH